MTFGDIFKKSFLEGFSGEDISIYTAMIALLIAWLIGMYIFAVYRSMTSRTFYSKSFNISLVAITLITCAIILTIQSSIVVSLGMVGALSIVRFRTAVKEPMDLVFLFWAIAVGIICGVGLAEIAVLLSVILTVAILSLDYFPGTKESLILVVSASDPGAEESVMKIVSEMTKARKVKSRNLSADGISMVIELRSSRGGELVRAVMNIESVTSASLIDHDGDAVL